MKSSSLKTRILFILFLFPGFQLFGQEKLDSIWQILSKRGEAYVSLVDDRYKSAFEASKLPGFDRMINDFPFLYLTKKDSLFIIQNLNEISIQTAPSMLYEVKMASTREEVLQGLAYPGYPLYLEIMEYFKDTWPEICTIDTIGYSVEGRILLAAHLAKDKDKNKLRPAFFYSSSMHGDEPLGYSFMLMLINELLTNYQNPQINDLFENLNIYINPLENPDGTYIISDSTVFGSVRYNANGVDLNRNYPNPVYGDHPDNNEWQPETVAMMDYLKKIKPNLSANFHGGAEVVNYPWDSYIEIHPDDDWLRFVSSEYADTAISKRPGYMSLFPGGITNGWEWYKAFGTRQDYVTYYLGGRELTIELFDVKTTPEYLISELWETNKNSLINYIHQAKYGLQGIVTDSVTGLALQAKIKILNYDEQSSIVYSDENSGYFVRYLKESFYDIEISADGYKPFTVNDFSIEDYTTQFVDVRLQILEDTLLPLTDRIYIENLFNNYLNLRINNPSEQNMGLYIYNLSGAILFSENYYLIEGVNDIQLLPILPQGIFLLKLIFPDEEQSYKIFKY